MDTLQIILSVVTAVAAIIALFISIVEIKKSNKQALFERRLKVYLTVKWMKSLCDAHRKSEETYLKEMENGPVRTIYYMFDLMTNCTCLEELQGTLKHTLDEEYQRKYLLKMESLRNMCEEVVLIFPENIGYPLADFIFYYEEMLVAMYKYQCAIESIRKECNDFNKPFPNDDELEIKCRNELKKYLSGTFELADRLFNNGTLRKAASKIKL